jgi:hypothetical protein
VLVSTAALVFAGLALFMVLRARAGTGAGGAARSDPLEDLVRLDAAYANREGQVPASEWNDYLRRRAALKSAAEAALASRHRRS